MPSHSILVVVLSNICKLNSYAMCRVLVSTALGSCLVYLITDHLRVIICPRKDNAIYRILVMTKS